MVIDQVLALGLARAKLGRRPQVRWSGERKRGLAQSPFQSGEAVGDTLAPQPIGDSLRSIQQYRIINPMMKSYFQHASNKRVMVLAVALVILLAIGVGVLWARHSSTSNQAYCPSDADSCTCSTVDLGGAGNILGKGEVCP